MTTWHREHELLLAEAMRWATGASNTERARELRHKAIQANHQHYLERIPLYRDLARRARVDAGAPVENIARELLLQDKDRKSVV